MKKVYMFAVFMAVIAGISVYLFASSVDQKAQAGSSDKKNVVVATVEIPANSVILADMVQVAALQSDAVSPYALSDISQAVGSITKNSLLPGEQILSPRLVAKGSKDGSLSFELEEGQRAVSIGVDDISGVSGYIEKGDYVDVIATVIAKNEAGENKAVSTSLVENLLVLEVGAKPTASDTAAVKYTTITVSATTEEALKINYAATNGKLRLLLRPILDDKTVYPEDYSS